MRVLLTGASGFVGKAVLKSLLRTDIETLALSRNCPNTTGDYTWTKGNLLDLALTRKVVTDFRPDTIVHLAWNVEHGTFWTSPANLDWVSATLNLARSGAETGATRFIGTGTCYEYDWPLLSNCHEFTTPLKPAQLYGVAKDATRRILDAYANQAMRFAWARIFFPYGAGEGVARLIPSVSRALANGEIARCSSGFGVRDFMVVQDVGQAIAALALSNVIGPVNIASGEGISIADLALQLGAIAGKPQDVHIGALPDRPNEPPRIVADITRLRDEVGFMPQFSLAGGLKQTFDYWSHRVKAQTA